MQEKNELEKYESKMSRKERSYGTICKLYGRNDFKVWTESFSRD